MNELLVQHQTSIPNKDAASIYGNIKSWVEDNEKYNILYKLLEIKEEDEPHYIRIRYNHSAARTRSFYANIIIRINDESLDIAIYNDGGAEGFMTKWITLAEEIFGIAGVEINAEFIKQIWTKKSLENAIRDIFFGTILLLLIPYGVAYIFAIRIWNSPITNEVFLASLLPILFFVEYTIKPVRRVVEYRKRLRLYDS